MSFVKSFCALAILAAIALPTSVYGVAIGLNFGANTATEVIVSPEHTAALDALTGTGAPVWYNLSGATGAATAAGALTIDWNSSGLYNAGQYNVTENDASQQVFRGYLDDGEAGTSYQTGDGYGVSIEITGLSSWLSSIGATSYSVTLIHNTDWRYSTDTTGAGTVRLTDFTDVHVRSGLLDGSNAISDLPLLHTFDANPANFADRFYPTGANDNQTSSRRDRGTRYWQQEDDFTANSITVAALANPGTTTGPRGSIAAVILSAVSENITSLTIDRQTGGISLGKIGLEDLQILGYSFTSSAGSFDNTNWLSISNNYDDSGNGLVDSNDDWTVLTNVNSHTDLSEFNFDTPGDPGIISHSAPVNLGTPWLQTPFQDVVAELKLANGSSMFIPVNYTGVEIPMGDFTGDGSISASDWQAFLAADGASFAGLSKAEAYLLGDLDGDFDRDLFDFGLFEELFDEANGPGAFAHLLSNPVPEPGAMGLLAVVLGVGWGVSSRRSVLSRLMKVGHRCVSTSLGLLLAVSLAGTAQAVSIGLNFGGNFDGEMVDAGENTAGLDALTGTGAPTWYNFLGAAGTGTAGPLSVRWDSAINYSAGQENEPAGDASQQVFRGYLDDGDATPSYQPADGYGGSVNIKGITNWLTSIQAVSYKVTLLQNSDVSSLADFTDTEVRSGVLTGNNAIASLPLLHTFNANSANFGNHTYPTGENNGVTSARRGQGTRNMDQMEGFDDKNIVVASKAINSGIRGSIASIIISADPVDPVQLTVNTSSGLVSIKNTTGVALTIDSYRITSSLGTLDSDGWTSLYQQDLAGFPAGSTPTGTDGWVEGPGANQFGLTEYYLDDESFGPSVLEIGQSVSLGQAYAGTGQANDLALQLRTTSGVILTANVVFTETSVYGDYNGDGFVNLADYTVWRDNLGASITLPSEDPSQTPGQVTVEDYAVWKANFGQSTGGLSTSLSPTTVPEPSGVIIAGLAMVSLIGLRKKCWSLVTPLLLCLSVCLLATDTAKAAVHVDRLFSLGDDPFEGGNNGDVVGSANVTGGGILPNTTLDGEGPSGAYIDAHIAAGDPRYVDVSDRPLLTGGSQGVAFDGNDLLRSSLDDGTGISLNAPARFWNHELFDGDPLTPGVQSTYPFNYSNIFQHGMEVWAKPANATPNARQDLVLDSLQHGILITENNTWGMLHHAVVVDSGVPITNQWTHLMKITRDISATNQDDVAVLFVDGIAVAALAEGYNTNDHSPLAIGANQDASGNFYTGVLDDLRLFLWGNNTGTAAGPNGQMGMNYGTFTLSTDNVIVANAVGSYDEADVNLDGSVDQTDVSWFVTNWLHSKVLDGVPIGDLSTRAKGDLNYDGLVNLDDAVILHFGLLGQGQVGLNFSLLTDAKVPEPSAIILLATVALSFCTRRTILGVVRDRGN